MNHIAPWWLPGGHLQTIWPALWARRTTGQTPQYQRERWPTPDGDHIVVDFGLSPQRSQPTTPALEQDATRPLLVLFHGLEGSSRSHYAEAFADWCAEQGWHFAVPHFRGCGGEFNTAPRAYHSGDFAEIDWILQRMCQQHHRHSSGPVVAVGVSLGGNALLRWAGEVGAQAAQQVAAVAAISSPLDLAASGHAIGRGFNRLAYTRMFLGSMKPKAMRKLAQHPGLFDGEALLNCRTLYEFDNLFTAPLHGFKNTDDYWARASAKPHLQNVRVPALLLNARNDPFMPAWSLPQRSDISECVNLWQPAHGGHVGFAQGSWPGQVRGLPDAVGAWLRQVVAR